jgi:hypothetical protein
MTNNDLIAAAWRTGKVLLHRMIDDLAPADFRHQPCRGANSAAWIVGHLGLTARRTAERLGATNLPAVSDELTARLATTKQPAGEQLDLGDPAELVRLFDECVDAVIEGIKRASAETLAGPSPVQGPFGSTYAEGLQFGGLHIAMHVGQLSTIRRSLGKPPVV